MSEFFTSDIFISSAMAVVLSLVIYLVTRILCSLQGIGKNEIVRVLGFLERADKNLGSFQNLSNKGALPRDKARKLLLSIRIYIGNSASALQVYVYDREEDKPKIRAAVNKLNALDSRCDNIALYYNDKNNEKLEATINGIRSDLKKVVNLISLYKKELDENRKKVI